MADYSFANEGQEGAELLLASAGFAVLIPNTRGRGGEGYRFHTAFAAAGSDVEAVHADTIAGVDHLIAIGIADPHRLAIAGHSMGHSYTLYTLMKDHRFRAAVVHDAYANYPLMTGKFFDRDSSGWYMNRDDSGISNFFDPKELRRIYDRTPAFNFDKIKTPLLMSEGEERAKENIGFLRALRSRNVSARMYIYKEPHRFQSPLSIQNDLLRTFDWISYWVQ